jgi:hypothetical protein
MAAMFLEYSSLQYQKKILLRSLRELLQRMDEVQKPALQISDLIFQAFLI